MQTLALVLLVLIGGLASAGLWWARRGAAPVLLPTGVSPNPPLPVIDLPGVRLLDLRHLPRDLFPFRAIAYAVERARPLPPASAP